MIIRIIKIISVIIMVLLSFSLRVEALPIYPICMTSDNNLFCGLVGYWTFDGKNMIKGVAKDISGNNNNANLINISTSTFFQSGKLGQSFNFDGIDDYINAGSASSLDDIQAQSGAGVLNRGMAVSFWIKPRSNTTKTIIVKGDGTNNSGTWSITKDSTTNPARLIFNKEGSTDSSIYYDNFFTNNVWQHVVILWNSSMTFSTGVKVYKDGLLISQTGATDGATANSDASFNLNIGGDSLGSSFSDTFLDNIRIYNRTLSYPEINHLYNMGVSRKQATSPQIDTIYCNNNLSCGLVGYWTFDGKNIGNNIIDSSGQGNTGYIVNNTSTSTSVIVGKIGQGITFDGVNDYIVTKNTVNTAKVTISAWIKMNSIPSSNVLITGFIDGINSSTYDKDLYIDTSGKLRFYVNDGSGKTTSAPSTAIPMNTWVHVMGVADGINAYTYVNGVQAGSIAAGNTYTSYTVPNIFIQGQSNSVPTSGGYGSISIDDVRVYSRALSGGEIIKLYGIGSTKIDTSTRSSTTNCNNNISCGLIGYWTFDGKDIVNGLVKDISANNHDGTLVNIATSTFYVLGRIGQAVSFSTTQNNAIHAVNSFAPPVSGFSISFWMKTSQTGSPVILGWGNRFARLGGVTANKLSFVTDGSSAGSATSICDANDNKWHHMVLSSTPSSQILYCDNIPSNTTTETLDTVSALFIFGKALSGDTTKYNGLFDDVRIYNRPLSASEVMKLYAMGSNK